MRHLLASLLLVSTFAVAQPLPVNPNPGPVPDEAAAIAIAVAVLKPIYGAEQLALQRPLVATLENGRWHVQGSRSPGTRSTVAEIWIAKDDGHIVKATRGR